MDERLEQARRRWLAQRDDASEREYHVALERAGWPWETAHLQRVGGWRLERVLCGYTVGANLCQAAAFSRDGRRLVTSDATRLRVWDVATRRRVHGGGPIGEETDRLSLSLDGAAVLFVPGGSQGRSQAELWRLDPWERVATFAVDGATCDDATHLADGRIVTLHDDGVARVWSAGALEREAVHGELPLARGRGRVVARPGGGFVTLVAGDPRPIVWSPDGARASPCERPEGFDASDATPEGLAVSADDRLLAAAWGGVDSGVAVFDLTTLEERARREDLAPLGALSLIFTPDALVLRDSLELRVLDRGDLQDRDGASAPWGDGQGLAVTPDERLACVGGAVVDARTLREPAPAHHRGPIARVGFTPDTPRAASVSPMAVCVWDLETGGLDRSLPTPRGQAALTASARSVVIPAVDRVRLIELETYEARALPGLPSTYRLTFQPNGPLVAEQSRDRVVMVDLRDGRRLWQWSDPEQPLGGLRGMCAAFTGDGLRLLLVSREGVLALDAARGTLELRAPWPEAAPLRRAHVQALAAAPDGDTVVAVTTNARLVTFDATTGALRAVVALDGPAAAARFGADPDVLFVEDDRGWRAVDARTGLAVANPPLERACAVDFRLPVEAEERAGALAVSEDGERLLLGTNAGSVLLFAR